MALLAFMAKEQSPRLIKAMFPGGGARGADTAIGFGESADYPYNLGGQQFRASDVASQPLVTRLSTAS
jgi:hypothetical protein